MCGIIGILNYRGDPAPQVSALRMMAQAMRHRGPDDEGYVSFDLQGGVHAYYGDDSPESVRRYHADARHVAAGMSASSFLAFGHRRLSILDLSPAGHQPMSYGGGRYWIAYNGEVYNYLEIQQDLLRLGYVSGPVRLYTFFLNNSGRCSCQCFSASTGEMCPNAFCGI